MSTRIITGDCRSALQEYAPFDMLIADPPYGDTSLAWDQCCAGWIETAAKLLKPTGSMWVFGSMRFFQDIGVDFRLAGWKYAQDIVWEKNAGSGLHADRFKRVHEHIVQYYRVGAAWGSVYNDVQRTPGKPYKMTVPRPPHFGGNRSARYTAVSDGPRIMRSVILMKNLRGRAIHPTEKPSDLIEIIIRTSCHPGGLVGDMFAGSGSAGEAAMRSGRDYIGTEIDISMADKARNRLSGLLPLVSVPAGTMGKECWAGVAMDGGGKDSLV